MIVIDDFCVIASMLVRYFISNERLSHISRNVEVNENCIICSVVFVMFSALSLCQANIPLHFEQLHNQLQNCQY